MIIDNPRDTDGLQALWKCAFGDPDPYIQSFFALGFQQDRCLCVYQDDTLAAALYWFDCYWAGKRLAYLYAVATDPAFRGQGICRRLMDHAHAHLRTLGYAGAVLVPGNAGLFAMYEKFGYRCFGGIHKFSCPAADEPVPVRVVCQAEYARLRRLMLPENGVVQEDACLAFLHAQAQFYAGDSFVLCAARENDNLIVLELLGDGSAAAGIVKALGCSQGQFRIPGSSRFAMYLPLDGSRTTPAYFGIALD